MVNVEPSEQERRQRKKTSVAGNVHEYEVIVSIGFFFFSKWYQVNGGSWCRKEGRGVKGYIL